MMHNQHAVLEVSPANFDAALSGNQESTYAALISSIGYEQRSSHIARELVARRRVPVWAYEYPHNQVLFYDKNRDFFESKGLVISEPESAYRKDLAMRIRSRRDEVKRALDQIGDIGPIRFAVDISSMDRDRLARTVLAFGLDQTFEAEVDFYYAFGAFDQDLVGSEGRVTVNRSIDGLDGWTGDPNLPVACIIGAGFESRLALAALETLEPRTSIWLVPEGPDARYDKVVRDRNAMVLSEKPIAVSYRVDQPYRVLQDLEATVAALVRDNRVVLVPLGPKIFALCSILTGLAYDTNVTVWRLSADSDRQPENRDATGLVVGLRVKFGGSNVVS